MTVAVLVEGGYNHTVPADAPLIIVADDDRSTAAWLKDVLELAGYRVLATDSGRKALELVGSERPALLLSDLAMPDLDGWTLIDRVREQHPDVRVAVVTAETAAPRDVPVMRKPLRIDDLTRFVKRALGRRAPR